MGCILCQGRNYLSKIVDAEYDWDGYTVERIPCSCMNFTPITTNSINPPAYCPKCTRTLNCNINGFEFDKNSCGFWKCTQEVHKAKVVYAIYRCSNSSLLGGECRTNAGWCQLCYENEFATT